MTSIFDDDRAGRSTEVTTSGLIEKIYDIVIFEKVREIAETDTIEQVPNI